MTTANPSAREVFDALAAEHLRGPGTGRRRMFGRDCLTVDGHNVAFFHDERLVLDLPPAEAAALIESGEAGTAYMGQRVMRGWAAVPLPPDGAGDRWRELLAQAIEHVIGSHHGPPA